ncbi:MAG: hypothetical protein NXI25_04660 [bacterium]|nr:hypothetical protein [bacterium]
MKFLHSTVFLYLTVTISNILLTGSILAQKTPPNIILIMADDLGYETLTCNGGESYQTPQLTGFLMTIHS